MSLRLWMALRSWGLLLLLLLLPIVFCAPPPRSPLLPRNAGQLRMVSSITPQSPGPQLTQFMHFSVCSFDVYCLGNPQGYRLSDPSFFNPTDLDADQWVSVAKSWGATEICLTARHASGFAIWQTNLTSYGVKESPWKGGRGDVVREFVDACRRGGVLPCLYFSPLGDVEQALNVKNDTEAHINNLAMLEELLVNYGPISRLWWDGFATSCSTPGANPNNTCRTGAHGAPSYDCRHPVEVLSSDCPAWYDFITLVNRVSPSTIMVPGPDGNLVNPEVLGGTYPLWHAVQTPYAVPPPPPPAAAAAGSMAATGRVIPGPRVRQGGTPLQWQRVTSHCSTPPTRGGFGMGVPSPSAPQTSGSSTF